MLKYTRHFLQKLEAVLGDLGYRVSYGHGNFQFGHCIVTEEKRVVVNKYFDLEGRIQGLLEILASIPVEFEKLTPASQKFVKQLIRESILFNVT